MSKPRVLLYDIETRPLEVYTWGIYEQNVAPNQIVKDTHLLSWAAKWLGEKCVMYMDQRKAKDISNDKTIVQGLWDLLDEADIVITQNGISFDQKRVYARFIYHGMTPPSPSKHIDTKRIAKKNFGFTSNGLAYLSENLGDVKKSEHGKFPGMDLWRECLRGNLAAWREMEKYNKRDVLALEAVYNRLRVWDTSISVAANRDGCRNCGSHKLQARGYELTAGGKQQRYQCQDCGSWMKSGVNLLSKKESSAIKRKV